MGGNVPGGSTAALVSDGAGVAEAAGGEAVTSTVGEGEVPTGAMSPPNRIASAIATTAAAARTVRAARRRPNERGLDPVSWSSARSMRDARPGGATTGSIAPK